eukprot:30828-Pelagococcus_subviridis.AAC.16
MTDRAARREVSSADARVTTDARLGAAGATARARRDSVLPTNAGRATTAEVAEVMAAISTVREEEEERGFPVSRVDWLSARAEFSRWQLRSRFSLCTVRLYRSFTIPDCVPYVSKLDSAMLLLVSTRRLPLVRSMVRTSRTEHERGRGGVVPPRLAGARVVAPRRAPRVERDRRSERRVRVLDRRARVVARAASPRFLRRAVDVRRRRPREDVLVHEARAALAREAVRRRRGRGQVRGVRAVLRRVQGLAARSRRRRRLGCQGVVARRERNERERDEIFVRSRARDRLQALQRAVPQRRDAREGRDARGGHRGGGHGRPGRERSVRAPGHEVEVRPGVARRRVRGAVRHRLQGGVRDTRARGRVVLRGGV